MDLMLCLTRASRASLVMLAIAASLLLSSVAWSGPSGLRAGEMAVTLNPLHKMDGDTVRLETLDGRELGRLDIRLRFRGFDTPEFSGPTACRQMAGKARELLWEVLTLGQLSDETPRGVDNWDGHFRLTLSAFKRDPWGRIVATARLPSGKLVSDEMLRRGEPIGLVRRYFRGASRSPWPRCR